MAGAQGAARVVTRPRSEAERLINRARATAMLGGLNLTFSLEQQAYKSRRDLRKTLIQLAVNGILLILVLSAVSLARADGATGATSREVAPGPGAGITYFASAVAESGIPHTPFDIRSASVQPHAAPWLGVGAHHQLLRPDPPACQPPSR